MLSTFTFNTWCDNIGLILLAWAGIDIIVRGVYNCTSHPDLVSSLFVPDRFAAAGRNARSRSKREIGILVFQIRLCVTRVVSGTQTLTRVNPRIIIMAVDPSIIIHATEDYGQDGQNWNSIEDRT